MEGIISTLTQESNEFTIHQIQRRAMCIPEPCSCLGIRSQQLRVPNIFNAGHVWTVRLDHAKQFDVQRYYFRLFFFHAFVRNVTAKSFKQFVIIERRETKMLGK